MIVQRVWRGEPSFSNLIEIHPSFTFPLLCYSTPNRSRSALARIFQGAVELFVGREVFCRGQVPREGREDAAWV